jgi:hypothetical protein
VIGLSKDGGHMIPTVLIRKLYSLCHSKSSTTLSSFTSTYKNNNNPNRKNNDNIENNNHHPISLKRTGLLVKVATENFKETHLKQFKIPPKKQSITSKTN